MALSRLFQALYGISLRLSEVSSGEVWHTDVRKFEVVDEEQGVLGWIYADLFARTGKPGGAAHYTVRCSRRTDDDEEHGDLKWANKEDDVVVQLSRDFEASKRFSFLGQSVTFQLPVVVLLCEFMRPSISRGPTILEWHEVLTLFHEMGHAMHCEYLYLIMSSKSGTHEPGHSNDRQNGVSECIGYSLCYGLRGTTVDPHGTFPQLADRPLPL